MLSRILMKGKNKNFPTYSGNPDFPKRVFVPVGVRQDDSTAYKHMDIRADQCLCPRCEGWGRIDTWDGNPSSREVSVPCPVCDGDSIVKVAA